MRICVSFKISNMKEELFQNPFLLLSLKYHAKWFMDNFTIFEYVNIHSSFYQRLLQFWSLVDRWGKINITDSQILIKAIDKCLDRSNLRIKTSLLVSVNFETSTLLKIFFTKTRSFKFIKGKSVTVNSKTTLFALRTI